MMRRNVTMLLILLGCEGNQLTRDQLLDPASCAGCHPDHVAQWEGSMHAYASEDPVFRALNAMGQRETNGELGDFCVQCHAPMALREGATTDGTNLDAVDDHLEGVTCAFCHLATDTTGDANAAIVLQDDHTMRGGLADPIRSSAHDAAYSPLHDRNSLESSELCGSCHDVVTPLGMHLETTFLEWKNSQYSLAEPGLQQTCGSCHMPGYDGRAAEVFGAPVRRLHDHAMPGVDVALTPFPGREAQREAVQRSLDTTVLSRLEVFDYGAGTGITVTLENVSAGHHWPSGATHDRRGWVELVAYEGDEIIWSSGMVGERQRLFDLEDPYLWWFGAKGFTADNEPSHRFWEIERLESSVLAAPSRTDPAGSGNHVTRTYDLAGLSPDRVTMRIRLRPLDLGLVDALVEAGDLAPEVADALPTFTLGATETTWVRTP